MKLRLIRDLITILRKRSSAGRLIAAIAGAPGSGKSTLAANLVDQLNANDPSAAAVLPMDGYHYDDQVLVPRGLRPRKGAPETFDVAGLRHILMRLRQNDEAEIAIPVFDRSIEIARAAAATIAQNTRLILVEGNYLLLDRAPWTTLRPLFDITIMIDVSEATLRARLNERWVGYGLSPAEIEAKLELNDLPNGRVIIAESTPADFVLSPDA